MKKGTMCAVLAAAMIAASSMSVFAYADDTVTAESESVFKITRGVWAAHGEDDKIVDYYIFDSEKSGHTEKPENGLGLPFDIEQNDDGTAVIHFGGVDSSIPAVIKGVDTGLCDFTLIASDEVSVTYRLELLEDEDPDTFAAGTSEEYFNNGVYAAYISTGNNTVYDKLDDYFVFTSSTEGYTSSPLMGIGLPFSIEQNGATANLHFADSSDSSKMSIVPLENDDYLVKITYADESSTTYHFTKLDGIEPDGFDGASAYYGTFESVDDGIQLYNANGVFNYILSSPAADDIGLEINYAMPLLEGFDIDFVFMTADKNYHTFNLSYNGEIDNDTVFVNLKDLLSNAGVDGNNVVSFTVKNKDSGTICKLGFVGQRNNSVKLRIALESFVDSAQDEQNPSTGSHDIFAAGLLAVFAGLTAAISRKRK